MALQCGIIGIIGSGKTSIFNCISNTKAVTESFSNKTNVGVVEVPDDRLYVLDKLEHSNRIVHATVAIVDIPGLVRSAGNNENSGNKFLADIRNTDALIHVVRCFDEPTLPHPDITIDPIRDIENIEFELQARDLESVEKKIIRFEKQIKAGDKKAKRGIEVMQIYKSHIESFKPARIIEISEQDKRFVDDLCLLSAKKVLYVANVDSKSAVTGNNYSNKMYDYLKQQNAGMIIIAGKLEAEIAELESTDDRNMFLEDAGLKEPGVNKLVRAAYELLNLRTFFTVGPKEIKAWTIHKGMTAPQAAGVIHSDLERGFIRAEVMKYIDYTTLKTEHACKEKGKLFVEGKNYIVEDGDILNIRFNV
ncbi:MAG: redox-regulated ATPase YchF [Bacteroidetes bacterium CG02_land_8_20_14_3_00_31_25]|nr:redox-regulated ATPase YchF [Bacteroidota bacterium]PIV57823.1 MAG: redox-regulated ATPase YchF [Bacteroidetes bacterium CG02_land_8_20_14_3_00_31_25]PIX36504.1 MAG: redox-regulated ATPase YchF [Bacteroidetes bacterium CG_4_8_14_3_um_filter_31_14]PIY05279.1 MAG: redox-regulated ATPase YchF [Bacteroidetes bacterium CG_4_10_14_3_um_filter_31_20]